MATPEHLIKAKAIIEEFIENMRPEDGGTLERVKRYIDAMIEESETQEETDEDSHVG